MFKMFIEIFISGYKSRKNLPYDILTYIKKYKFLLFANVNPFTVYLPSVLRIIIA